MSLQNQSPVIAGRTFRSRLILGTGKFSSPEAMRDALEASGAEIVTVRVGHEPNPWLEFGGMFKDDPDFKEVVEIIAENRRKMDEDPNVP